MARKRVVQEGDVSGEHLGALIEGVLSAGALGLPPMHERQRAFVLASEHRAAFVGGIGSGKTYSGAWRALRAAYGLIGTRPIRTPNTGMVVAPTYPMLTSATLRTLMEVVRPYVKRYKVATQVIELKNGSEIMVRTAQEPDRLRGPNLSWWWGDEAAMFEDGVSQIMLGRLREYGERGSGWITTTPKGKNWVWREFVGEGGTGKDGAFLQTVKSRDNTFLQEDVLQAWESSYTGDEALQELGGEFLSYRGLVYASWNERTNTVVTLPDVSQFKRVVVGCDFGFVNPAVILVVGITGDGDYYVCHEFYQTMVTVPELGAELRRIADTWGVEEAYCDPSQPKTIEAFRARGVDAMGADNSVFEGISKVQAVLPKLYISSQCRNTLEEMGQYKWLEGNVGYKDKPMKVHDHAMDALRYAVSGLVYGTMQVKARGYQYV